MKTICNLFKTNSLLLNTITSCGFPSYGLRGETLQIPHLNKS